MNRRVAVDSLLQHATFQPAEAVAVVQQLIHAPSAATLTAPFGPPTPATVFVGSDGSVSCATCDAPLAVSELANLLDAMMPAGRPASVGIPGGLRYTIARARMEVDAPPFDSVNEFSQALARHERGDRVAAIQRVIARANSANPDSPLDRRRGDPAIAHLRRQLRDADARVYDQQRAIDTLCAMTAQPPSGNRRIVLAGGVLIGLTFVGAGQLMREPSAPPAPLQSSHAATTPAEPSPVTPQLALDKVTNAVRSKPTTAPTVKRVSHATASARDRKPSRPRRFQWLRTRFAFRSERL